LYDEQPKKIFLKKYYQAQYGKFILTFNKGTDSLGISKLNKEELAGVKELIEYSKAKDTIIYWIDPVDKDSLILQVNNGKTIMDTLRFKLIKRESTTKASRVPFKLTPTNSLTTESFDLNKNIQLVFSHPVEKINDVSVLLKEDSLNYSKYPLIYAKSEHSPSIINVTSATAIDPKNSSRNKLLKENTTYSLTVPPATFTDFFGLTNDTIQMRFRTKEEKFYGSVKLTLTFENTTGNYIVQLLDEKENVVRESLVSKQENIFYYDYLYPTTYKLKVIFDKNANGKWDGGNYLKKQQPEKVIYNTESINIRSNWDMELEWKIFEPK
ncbi:MAG TPA: Ig-like domain-containing protein, partial [Bacteroidia bacterium]|nr:Ig-like domain-containing protein [Bacteroidia bacterium]